MPTPVSAGFVSLPLELGHFLLYLACCTKPLTLDSSSLLCHSSKDVRPERARREVHTVAPLSLPLFKQSPVRKSGAHVIKLHQHSSGGHRCGNWRVCMAYSRSSRACLAACAAARRSASSLLRSVSARVGAPEVRGVSAVRVVDRAERLPCDREGRVPRADGMRAGGVLARCWYAFAEAPASELTDGRGCACRGLR